MMIAVILAAVGMPQIGAAGEPPARLLWSVVLGTNAPGITYGVRQIVADGSGGCALFFATKSSWLSAMIRPATRNKS
ncbi:MAG: hypothetical protein NTV22_09720 [bacterium]|nr:hypothetical protein [bacterium]